MNMNQNLARNMNQLNNERYDKRNLILYVTSIFISNIGNGIQNLAIASQLYNITGNVLSFAVVLSSEYIISAALQLYVGPFIDRNPRKTILITSDLLRGITLVVWVILFAAQQQTNLLLIAIIAMNVIKPFYRSAMFAYTGELFREEFLLKANGWASSALQSGQLLGVSIAALVIAQAGTSGAIAVNGLSFLLSAVLMLFTVARFETTISSHKGGILRQWQDLLAASKSKTGVLARLFSASSDFVYVALINLLLVPWNSNMKGTPITLALMDGLFALGSIGGGILLSRLRTVTNQSVFLAQSVQALGFFALLLANLPLACFAMLAIGVANTVSMGSQLTRLQLLLPTHRGKISSARHFVLSFISPALLWMGGILHREWGITAATIGLVLICFAYIIMFRLLVQQSKQQ
jgi:MFS transporter, DHA3 family, macrolide efflux protein